MPNIDTGSGMGAYNLDTYERLIFDVPQVRRLRYLHIVFGLLFGAVIAWMPHLFRTASVQGRVGATEVVLCVAFFIVPAVVSAELVHILAPGFKRNWAYLVALVGHIFLFLFAVGEVFGLGRILLGNHGSLFGFGTVFVFLTTFAVLVLAAGTDRFLTVVVASTLYPVLVLVFGHAGAIQFGAETAGFLVVLPSVYETATVMSLTGVGMVVSVLWHEWLFDSNVEYIDGATLTSALLQMRPESIDLENPPETTEPRVHTLRIETEDDTVVFLSPWVHPGPIAKFGGGYITADVIENLNDRYDGGFYLKAPASHKLDPATSEASERVFEGITDPATHPNSTRMITSKCGDLTLHGRRFDNQRIVFVEPPNKDDFDLGVVADVVDPENTFIVDRHAEDEEGYTTELYEASEAKRLRSELRNFLEELDTEETYRYHAGCAVDYDNNHDQTAVIALVECVDGQETLLIGSNENEMSGSLESFKKTVAEDFDKVVSFTTDTHHSLGELADRAQPDESQLESVVKKAREECGDASIGFGVGTAGEMKFLGKEYYALMYSINIVLRSFTVSLGLLYLSAFLLFYAL